MGNIGYPRGATQRTPQAPERYRSWYGCIDAQIDQYPRLKEYFTIWQNLQVEAFPYLGEYL